jgi:hypothetical protein
MCVILMRAAESHPTQLPSSVWKEMNHRVTENTEKTEKTEKESEKHYEFQTLDVISVSSVVFSVSL